MIQKIKIRAEISGRGFQNLIEYFVENGFDVDAFHDGGHWIVKAEKKYIDKYTDNITYV